MLMEIYCALCATLTIGCVAGFSGCGKEKAEETAEVTEEPVEEEVVEEEEDDTLRSLLTNEEVTDKSLVAYAFSNFFEL